MPFWESRRARVSGLPKTAGFYDPARADLRSHHSIIPINAGLVNDAFDIRSQLTQFRLELLIAAIQVLGSLQDCSAFSRQACQGQGRADRHYA